MLSIASIVIAVAGVRSVHGATLTTRADPVQCGTVVDLTYGVNKCLCGTNIPSFVDQDPALQAGIRQELFTRSSIISALDTEHMTGASASNARTCIFPENSTPFVDESFACDPSNPCDFICDDGYQQSGNSCVETPRLVPRVPQATARKRALDYRAIRGMTCGRREERVCPLQIRGAQAFECIDVAKNLETCGGCMTPLSPEDPIGTDCSALPGVTDVQCSYGKCEVFSCRRGYTLHTKKDGNSVCLTDLQLAVKDEPTFQLGHGLYDFTVTADQLLALVRLFRDYSNIDYSKVVGSKFIDHAKTIVSKRGIAK